MIIYMEILEQFLGGKELLFSTFSVLTTKYKVMLRQKRTQVQFPSLMSVWSKPKFHFQGIQNPLLAFTDTCTRTGIHSHRLILNLLFKNKSAEHKWWYIPLILMSGGRDK